MIGLFVKNENIPIHIMIKELLLNEIKENKFIKVNDNIDDYITKINKNSKIVALMDYDNKLNSIKYNNCIGVCIYYCNDFINFKAYISQLLINKKYRNKGYVKNILDFVIYDLYNLNFNSIELEVNNDNKHALHVYEKYNFKITNNSNKSIYMRLNMQDYPHFINNIIEHKLF